MTLPLSASAGTRTPRLRVVSAYARILRPANLVTAAADIFTGWVVVSGRGNSLGWLVAASVCLYAGGVVLNDFFDRKLDAMERPERPLPSGMVPAQVAAVLGMVLLIAGIGVAFRASTASAIIACAIAAAVLLYDVLAKHNAAGPVVMGSCRALNLLLGLSAVHGRLAHTWLLTLLPLIYIAGITTLSRGEVHGGSRKTGGLVLCLFAAVVVGLFGPRPPLGGRWLSVMPFIVLLVARVLPPLWRAYKTPLPAHIRAAVHSGVVSLVILDSAIAASYGGVVIAAAILSLAVVTSELGRLFPVT